MKHKFTVKGLWRVQQIRDGKVIYDKQHPNGVTNIGKDTILDVMFGAASQLTPWYLGFIDEAGYSALAAGDTMGSHAGWTEFTDYAEADRPEWVEGAASGQEVTNGTPASFNITGSGTLKGGFLTSNNTKAGTTGILWGTALFSGDLPVSNGDIIKITYTVPAA